MNVLRRMAGAAAVAGLAVVPLVAAAPAASAASAATTAADIDCSMKRDGNWIHADCTNRGDSNGSVRLVIECIDWWEPDTYSNWVQVTPGRTVHVSDDCWSGPANWWYETR
ncbi:hypothetical protein [Streptomyces sp. NPDC014995]|uniref:hypothetical protein n=1 Tax=Streptomyces sp. NPDC014995 TaxID=3364936 RepID=UPI003702DDFA